MTRTTNWTTDLDLDVERLPREWWAEGEDDSLPDGLSEDQQWALIRRSGAPPSRAIALLAEGHQAPTFQAPISAVDALLEKVLPPDKATITVPEAGKVLGIGEASSYAAARRGEIPVLRFGEKRVVVPLPALRNLLEKGTFVTEDDEATDLDRRRVRPSSLRDRRQPGRVDS